MNWVLAIEGFLTIALVDVATAVVNIQPGGIDLSTSEGRNHVIVAVIGGVSLAIKSWVAKNLPGNPPSTTSPSSPNAGGN